MALNFAANLNFLFNEGSPKLAEKIKLAHQAKFRAVEIPFPVDSDVTDVINAKQESGVEIALINIALGPDEFKYGTACIPGAEDMFKTQFHQTVDVAKQLNCRKIHIMSGIMKRPASAEHLLTYIKNLKYATTILKREDLIGIIEPINRYSLPNYFMNSYETAYDILTEINSTHMKLMIDIFHLQHIRGNVFHTFKEFNNLIGHFQIAQVPERDEPDNIGELDYKYVFSLIKATGYTDWIGCEYKPKTTTLEGLKWIDFFGLSLQK